MVREEFMKFSHPHFLPNPVSLGVFRRTREIKVCEFRLHLFGTIMRFSIEWTKISRRLEGKEISVDLENPLMIDKINSSLMNL